jgi:hypothetical protein
VTRITGEFREIVEAHQSRIFSIAYRVLGDRGTADEFEDWIVRAPNEEGALPLASEIERLANMTSTNQDSTRPQTWSVSAASSRVRNGRPWSVSAQRVARQTQTTL